MNFGNVASFAGDVIFRGCVGISVIGNQVDVFGEIGNALEFDSPGMGGGFLHTKIGVNRIAS